MINNIPMTDAELRETTVPKHAIDEFKRQIQRNPTRTETQYLGRWNPQQAIRQAELNPDGEPDKLVSIRIPTSYQDVVFYCELCVCQVPGSMFGQVVNRRSTRYHNGDDALWPMRDSNGEIVRNDGGHILPSPTFRAPLMSVMPVTECTWPADVTNKGMWHVTEIIQPIHNSLIGKSPPAHFMVEGPTPNMAPKPTRESELEKRIADLENRLASKR